MNTTDINLDNNSDWQILLSEDQKARAEALDVSQSFIVKAPAGSGKTQLLIQRYLSLLASACEHPRQILALTFTRKAAATMRSSILAILRAARANTNSEAWLPDSWRLALAACQQAQRRGWQLIDDAEHLRIGTIDSFCSSICQVAPDLAPLPANFTLSPSPNLLYRRAARQLIYTTEPQDSWYPYLHQALVPLDNQAGLLENLLVRMLAQRDSWLGMDFADPQAWQDFCQSVYRDCWQLVDSELGADIEQVAAGLSATVEADAQLGQLAQDWRSAPLVAVQILGRHLLRADGGLRSRPTLKKNQPGHEANKRLLARLFADSELLSSWRECLILPAPELVQAEHQLNHAVLQLAKVAYANLQLIFAEQGQVDYQQVAAQATLALSTRNWRQQGSQHWQNIKHLLIDEFQDTSMGQWRLLQNLSADWSADGAYSVFLVGDPMQSIYRFRQCDLRLFTHIWQRQSMGQLLVKPLQLRQNFRSHQALVAEINSIFAASFPQRDDERSAAVSYSQAISTRSYQLLEPSLLQLFTDDAQHSYAGLVEHLHKIQARDPQASRALLIRQRTHSGSLLRALSAGGIDYASEQLQKASDNQMVMDLRCLLGALCDRLDDLSWFALLRSPLCGLDLGELLLLRQVANSGNKSPGFNLSNQHWQQQLAPSSRERVRLLLKVLAPLSARWGSCDLVAELSSAWRQLGGERYCSSADSAMVDYFFVALQQSLDSGWLDLDLLDELLANNSGASAAQDSANKVQVLTIHQAKGLEFDYVVLADLHQLRSSGQPGYLSHIDSQHQAQLFGARAYVPAEYGCYSYLQQLEKRQQQLEEARVIYVGCTRASKQLALHALVATDGKTQLPVAPRSNSLLALIWDQLNPSLG